MDDAIHALFAREAKRFLRACDGFVNVRIWGGAQAPPIGAGSLQGRSKPANLPVSGWWAGKAQELPIGMVPAVVSRQPSSDGVPERCKFASLRLLPEIRPWAEFVEVGTDQQSCITVCCRRCRLGGCAKLRILDLLASG